MDDAAIGRYRRTMAEAIDRRSVRREEYELPRVVDYGTFRELTASHHLTAFQGIQAAASLLTFSGGGSGGVKPVSVVNEPGVHGVVGSGGSSGGSGGVLAVGGSGGGAGAGGGGAGGGGGGAGGKLPFTGFAVAVEAAVSTAIISVGLVLRRVARHPRDGVRR